MYHRLCLTIVSLIPLCGFDVFAEDAFVPAPDTQKAGEHPPTPAESLAKITVPEGFHVTLFAAEPDVRQPIDMKFDARGRLWVAESYSYDGHHFVEGVDDRILILEDLDRDGRFDKRTVFWDKANRLTSLEFAPGGLFVLNAGELQYLPDRNGDDILDGPPVTLLDGFDTYEIGHNIVSGMIWGPDGWLYGRHGIKATSRPGPPEIPPAEREPINVGIWRFHPGKRKFEPVCHGTTNPWGLDYNEHGEFFFTNNVIGHLWHIIPGAHYKRMYGEDFNPHLYDLIDQHADHYHWDHSQNWTDSREGVGVHGELGGGHSHCGGMIYLGDNFPEEYRGRMFMCNTHGRRFNQDALVREGSGYVGKHAPDFFFANDPWFRGVSLLYGPDGTVFVSDWSDFGECHDHDGIHRSSGRIYRVSYGQPEKLPAGFDLGRASLDELVAAHSSPNEWRVRTARRLLLQRQLEGHDIEPAIRRLSLQLIEETDVVSSLRALFSLATLGRIDLPVLEHLLTHPDEHLRVWGLRLLAEHAPESRVFDDWLMTLATDDPSALVRLHLVSISPALPDDLQWSVLRALAQRSEDRGDHNLPLMIWYRMEPLIPENPARAVILLDKEILPGLHRHIARRVTSELDSNPAAVHQLVGALGRQRDPGTQAEILTGMAQALRGWRKAPQPQSWPQVAAALAASDSETVRGLAQELSLVFGDGRALDELRKVAADGNESPESRRRAVALLSQSAPPDLKDLLLKLLPDRATTPAVLEALTAFDDPNIAHQIAGRYRSFLPEHRPIAVDTLAARVEYARILLTAVAEGKIPREDITPDQARQLDSLGNAEIAAQLTKVWGSVRQTSAEKQALIAEWKALLTESRLAAADLSHGRLLYQKACANCHALYGQGSKIGPDLTGSNRDNLDYLLGNIIDPSSVVPQTFRMSVIALKDGRVLTGVVGRDDGTTLDVQTVKEKITIRKDEIEEIKASELSLMPDGLFRDLTDDDVRDLIGYLQSRRQVPLPPGAGQDE